MSVNVAAVDLGASSGRVMIGHVGRDRLALEAVSRFGNDPLRLPDGLHWNAGELFRQALLGLREAVRRTGQEGLASVAVDSWAVDYGLLREGHLLGLPMHYRDDRHLQGVRTVHAVVPRADLYERNGLQFLAFNSLYQLAADPLRDLADTVLLMPDLMTFWLSGQRQTERTNASTTGLLDPRLHGWDTDLCQRLGIADSLFPALVDPGTTVGGLTPEVAAFVGCDVPVTVVGSHDTASAVVGVPLEGPDAAYISCGTWGLVGVEVEQPVVTEASRAANFTNEGGVDGRTRLLTNVMGTWLLSETLRTWEAHGQPCDLASLLRQAAEADDDTTLFDVQDPRFVPPGDMPARIAAVCEERGLRAPASQAGVVRSIVESLAAGFARALAEVAVLSGRDIRTVHVVGGGAQNALLCQSIADHSGRTVVAGPVEATALGSVLVQARTAGALTGSLEDLRALIRRTHDLATYEPRVGSARMDL